MRLRRLLRLHMKKTDSHVREWIWLNILVEEA